MTKEEKIACIHNYVNAYNAFDVEGMLRHLHEDVVFRNYSKGFVEVETHGVHEFKRLAEQSKGVFSSRRQAIKAIKINGEVAEVEIDYKGVLAVDLPNGLKTGDTVDLAGRSIFHFSGNKIYILEDHS